MTAATCTSCGSVFRRKPEDTWKTTCFDCWKRGARREPVPVRIHRCASERECEARVMLRELAVRAPILLRVIEQAAPSLERESALTFLRTLVQRVAAIEGGR